MYNKDWKNSLCVHCNNPLKNARQLKFCSSSCSTEFRSTGLTMEEVTCKQCEIKFLKESRDVKRSSNHFCNRSCAVTFNNKNPKRTRKDRFCKRCSNEIIYHPSTKRSILCLECRKEIDANKMLSEEILNKTMEEFSFGILPPNDVKAKIRSHANTIIKSLGIPKICRRCRYSFHADIAHIKSITSFSKDSIIREINAPTNLIPLCKNCHWEFDHGNIPLEEILKLNEKMLEEFNYSL